MFKLFHEGLRPAFEKLFGLDIDTVLTLKTEFFSSLSCIIKSSLLRVKFFPITKSMQQYAMSRNILSNATAILINELYIFIISELPWS
jgi:hypothetical protein